MRTLALIFALLMPVVAIADKPRVSSEKVALAKYDQLSPEYREKCVKAWKKRKVDLAGNTAKIREHLENDPPFYPEIYPAIGAINGVHFMKGQWGHLNQNGATQYGVYVLRVIDKDKAVCRFGGTEFAIKGIDTSDLKVLTMNEISEPFYFDGTMVTVSSTKMPLLKPLPRAANTANHDGSKNSPNPR